MAKTHHKCAPKNNCFEITMSSTKLEEKKSQDPVLSNDYLQAASDLILRETRAIKQCP